MQLDGPGKLCFFLLCAWSHDLHTVFWLVFSIQVSSIIEQPYGFDPATQSFKSRDFFLCSWLPCVFKSRDFFLCSWMPPVFKSRDFFLCSWLPTVFKSRDFFLCSWILIAAWSQSTEHLSRLFKTSRLTPPLRVDLPSHKLSCVQAAARQAPHSLISKGRAPWSWVNNPNLNWNWSLVSLSSSLQASCVSSSCSSVKYDSFKSPDCPAFLTCGRAASADLTDSWRRHRQQYSTVQCSTVLLTRLLFLLQLGKVELNSASVCHSLVVSVSASHPASASSNPASLPVRRDILF